MNPVTMFSLISTNPLSKRAIKKLLEKDGETTKLDKLLRAYAYGKDVDGEFKTLRRLIDAGLKVFGGREDELKEKLRDKDRIEVCGKCRYRYVCGGCRARAYAYFKDYLAPDPGCVVAAQLGGDWNGRSCWRVFGRCHCSPYD
ncbi:hypothetical protein DRO97_04995 [Archaeoglobales archaeon]|nr:MAG: hypothetical protein DRO97_04995 [Archaeoglobales archaeon]